MKNKKVGILTFHDADNLGAVLQAYALESVIKKYCGASAEIINYKCNKITETKYVQKGRDIKSLIKAVPMSVYYKIKRRGFEKFRKEQLGCSKNTYNKQNIKDAVNDYDIFITGSDQVWNPGCSGEDSTYVLDFIADSAQKYSYAASIGNYDITKAGSEWIKSIEAYTGVSVREKTACEQLEKIGIDAQVHTDPVMLLSRKEWEAIMSKPVLKEKYVLVYLVLPDVNVMRKATEYAKEHNLKLITNKKSIEFILHNSPSEFLSWINNAEYVFTNSFHGTAFSLIFDKPLYADTEMSDGSVNKRVKDLLDAAKSDGMLDEMKTSAMKYLKMICKND